MQKTKGDVMDAHHLGARVRRTSAQWMIGLVTVGVIESQTTIEVHKIR